MHSLLYDMLHSLFKLIVAYYHYKYSIMFNDFLCYYNIMKI